MNATNFVVATATSAELVAFYNAANPEKTVKKFADRATAEKRVQAILDAEANPQDFATSAEHVATQAEADKVFDSATVSAPSANSAAFIFPKAADFLAATTKENSVFGFANGLVKVDVESRPEATEAEREAEAEFRGEEGGVESEETEAEAAARIEAEANAEKNGDEAPKKVSSGRRSNSEGVAASWLDKEVAAARLTRDGVTVTHGGVTVAYRSTREAFTALRLPISGHIRFRLALKASRKESMEFDGLTYVFEIVGG